MGGVAPPKDRSAIVFAALAARKRWPRFTRFGTFCPVVTPVIERLSSILPKGGADAHVHHGARRRFRRWALDAEIELLEYIFKMLGQDCMRIVTWNGKGFDLPFRLI